MYYKKGEVRPYLLGNFVFKGKIIKVNKDTETYTIRDLETKEEHVVDEDDIFLGDD